MNNYFLIKKIIFLNTYTIKKIVISSVSIFIMKPYLLWNPSPSWNSVSSWNLFPSWNPSLSWNLVLPWNLVLLWNHSPSWNVSHRETLDSSTNPKIYLFHIRRLTMLCFCLVSFKDRRGEKWNFVSFTCSVFISFKLLFSKFL